MKIFLIQGESLKLKGKKPPTNHDNDGPIMVENWIDLTFSDESKALAVWEALKTLVIGEYVKLHLEFGFFEVPDDEDFDEGEGLPIILIDEWPKADEVEVGGAA